MYLTKEQFYSAVQKFEGGHWTKETIDYRWKYHFQTISLVKELNIQAPKNVLEMGTMGICCVNGSDTLDYSERWDFPGKKPTFLHDARITPWPISDKKYELFIALRVYMHLVPAQEACIKEAMRISKKVIIVVPSKYENPIIPNSKGITYDEIVEFLNGIHPNIFIPSERHDFYFWDTISPSYINIKDLMLTSIKDEHRTVMSPTPPSSFTNRVKGTLRKIIRL